MPQMAIRSFELQKLKDHDGLVWAVTFSPSGQLLALASVDKTVRLWDPTTGEQQLKGHDGSVLAVAFSPDGQLLASASSDRTIRLWDPATGEQVQKLMGHNNSIRAVTFSPHGQLLASASKDETVRLWNPVTGEQVQKLEGHDGSVLAVAFSPDGQLLASASRTIRLWDPATGKQVQRLEDHDDLVHAVAFSPDGQLLASASDDKTVKLWALALDTEKYIPHTDSGYGSQSHSLSSGKQQHTIHSTQSGDEQGDSDSEAGSIVTIATDGQPLFLLQQNRDNFVERCASLICAGTRIPASGVLDSSRAVKTVSRLLRTFAVRLYAESSNRTTKEAATFIRHYRRSVTPLPARCRTRSTC